MEDQTMIIDPPVSPYSSPGDIDAWLDELRGMEESPDVSEAIKQAEEWLTNARKRK